MTVEERDTLIEFPCDFAIKAMGETSDDFDALIVSLVRPHVDELKEGTVKTRQSSGGKFTSVTVTVHVTSQIQLDTIYQALSGHESVKYVL